MSATRSYLQQIPAVVDCAEGDLFDAASLQKALEGVSAVVHLAAVFRTLDEKEI